VLLKNSAQALPLNQDIVQRDRGDGPVRRADEDRVAAAEFARDPAVHAGTGPESRTRSPAAPRSVCDHRTDPTAAPRWAKVVRVAVVKVGDDNQTEGVDRTVIA